MNEETCCPLYTIRLPLSTFKMSKNNKQVLKRFENYLHHGDIRGLEEKEIKIVTPKMCCSLNSSLKNAINHVISNHSWNIKLNDSVMQFKPCNRSKEYNFTTSVGITISNLLKQQNIALRADDISKEIINKMKEKEKSDFKYEVCENGYINLNDVNPIQVKEEYDKCINNSIKKKKKEENNSLMYILLL